MGLPQIIEDWNPSTENLKETGRQKIHHIKFRFSKKAAKFETISHMIWRLLSKCQKIKWEIVSNFCGLFRMSELYDKQPCRTNNYALSNSTCSSGFPQPRSSSTSSIVMKILQPLFGLRFDKSVIFSLVCEWLWLPMSFLTSISWNGRLYAVLHTLCIAAHC